MNGSEYGQQRPRGLPNGTHPNSTTTRPVYDARNGIAPSQATFVNGGAPAGSQISRAEKFEDEKRRLIESCFSKKETDGSLSESYITHIRIEEDAAYPSAPPPLQSPPDNKKPRAIVVAVRKSGRVRVHKARENTNGTFSIGKTWNLDDLTAIQSFTSAVPTTAEEQQNKQRAGNIGFVVTIQKPYYWQSATAKEKDFFIFSLIKIFKKYTGGRLPDLNGFSIGELEQLGSVGSSSSTTASPAMGSQSSGQQASRAADREVSTSRQPRTQNSTPEPARDHRSRPSQERTIQERGLYSMPGQEPTRTLHSAPSRDRQLRSTNSSDRMYVPGSFPSTDSVNTTQAAPGQLRNKRSESPGSHSTISQQSDYRRRDGPPTDGFMSANESRQSEKNLGYQPSNESIRPNGPVPMTLRPGPPDTRNLSTPTERPTIVAKHDELSTRHGSEEDEDFSTRPPPLTNRSYQRALPPQDPHATNGAARNTSSSRRFPDRGTEDPPNNVVSESHVGPLKVSASTNATTAQEQFTQDSTIPRNDVSETILAKTAETRLPAASTPTPPPQTPTEQEEFRPGLGPMIKKKSTKEIASQFRRAATAANAFKPRAGGAGDKGQNENTASGDGITGVFQAPSILRGIGQDDSRPATPKETTMPLRPATPQNSRPEIPSVRVVTSPAKSSEPVPQQELSQATPKEDVSTILREPSVKATSPPAQEERRKRQRPDHAQKYAKTLGIHPSLLEGRTSDMDDVLHDLGWDETNDKMTFEELQLGLRKELAYVEAGSWLGAVENNDDRTATLGEMMDKVIAECDELDGLLTLYNVELGTLTEDVAYIEAQSQGLQVQTANQKLLHTELKNLLDTISISSSDLKVLKDASLTNTKAIKDVEHTLAQLYAAMLTIDPKLAQSGARSGLTGQSNFHRVSNAGYGGNELSSMLAVREKRDGFRRDSLHFISRLKQYISVKFRELEAETLDALERKKNTQASSDITNLDPRLREESRMALWLYSPLLLFVREIELPEWDDLLRMYENCVKKPYQEEFKANLFAWKRITRKPAGDEQDILFTAQEKEPEGLVGRKLTVKRTKTVRSDGSVRASSGDRPNDGKVTAYEAFAGALTETAKIIFVEQNFVVDIFHASSLDTQDFIDAMGVAPEQRQGGDLLVKKPFDPDRDLARKISGVMEEIFSFWAADIQNLVDWTMKQDLMNSVGVLFALESQLSEIEETNQEFLSQTVSGIHDRLSGHFIRFVEEQIRGIEDTKVRIKRRKGVVAFIKTFPNFTAAIENMLPPTRSLDQLPIRSMVNDAYQSINKAMFESLKFIAKESPTATTGTTSSGDPEDKEILNLHILLVENLNHYIEEVPLRSNPVLEEWNFRARAEMSEHLNLYISAVIRRPLGKLLDFLESTESLIKNLPPSQSPPSIATRASHSRSIFKKLMSSYDGKEIRRGAETLKKRVEKHFGEADDTPGLSRELVGKVLKECENKYLDVTNRIERLIRDVYDGSLELEWRPEDVTSGFKR